MTSEPQQSRGSVAADGPATTALAKGPDDSPPDLIDRDRAPVGAALLNLVAVMDRLRSPGGCPWDAEQTHRSLMRYLVEETYEVVDAVESGDVEHLREELGDLLLQVVFHARIAEESTDAPFDIDEVATGIVDKLVRRHPHVFGDAVAADAAGVAQRWEDLKRAEKSERTSVLDGVPNALPALALAQSYITRAREQAIDVTVSDATSSAAGSGDDADAAAALVGDALLGLVAAAEADGVDAEAALRAAALRYAASVRAAERGAR